MIKACYKKLQTTYTSNDYEGIINICSKMLNSRDKLMNAQVIMSLLERAEHPSQWAALSTALGEAHIQESVPVIFNKIKDVSTNNFRGSLLGALYELDCRMYICDLIEIALLGYWEEACRAADLIEICLEAGLSNELHLQGYLKLCDLDRKIPNERKGLPSESKEYGLWRENYRWISENFS